MNNLSPYEVYNLVLINDLRASVGSQPLAFDQALLDSAAFHTNDQISKNTFQHTADLPGLISQFGWEWRSGSYGVWENHAWWGNAGLSQQAYTETNQQHLVNSPSHYEAMVNPYVRVAGIGIEFGPAVDGDGQAYQGLTDYAYVTQIFANNERQSFLTGVVYDDLNADGAFDPLEGENGTAVRIVDVNTGEIFNTTTDDGYYGVEVGSGTYDVFTFGGGADEQIADNLVVGNLNVRLDDRDANVIVDPDPPQTYTFTNPNTYQIITGFDPNEDILDFSGIDANPKKNAPGDQAFKWIPTEHKAGQHELWIVHQDFDVDGDLDTVFRIDTGNATNSIAYLTDVQLTPSDFTVGVDLIL
jgi:hypothetical protein